MKSRWHRNEQVLPNIWIFMQNMKQLDILCLFVGYTRMWKGYDFMREIIYRTNNVFVCNEMRRWFFP